MLHASILCSCQIIHCPLGPGIQPGQIRLVPRFLVEIGERQEGCHGIDVLRRSSFCKAISEPILDDLQRGGISCQGVVLVETVEANAVCPLPVVPAFRVDDSAIGKSQEEFACRVSDVDEVIGEQFDCLMHGCSLDTVVSGRHVWDRGV